MFVSSAFVITVRGKLPPSQVRMPARQDKRGVARNKFSNKEITLSSFKVPRNANTDRKQRGAAYKG
jgi:hypothetical protein